MRGSTSELNSEKINKMEALLLKPKVSKFEVVRSYFTDDSLVTNPNHQLFVPERFVLGHFKETRKGRFKLSPGGIYFRDHMDRNLRRGSWDFDNFSQRFENGKLEVVKKLSLQKRL